jgi:hypothetical protein
MTKLICESELERLINDEEKIPNKHQLYEILFKAVFDKCGKDKTKELLKLNGSNFYRLYQKTQSNKLKGAEKVGELE